VTHSPFFIKTIRRRIKAIGKNKPVGPDCLRGEILKLGGEAMIPYLAQLLDVTINKGTLPCDWKRSTMIPIHKGGRSTVMNYRPVSLLNLYSLQTNGTRYSFMSKASVG
jgi:hypothetical protein